MKIFTDNVDPKTLSKLYNLDKSGLFENIRIMPDVHEGSSIVGFTGYFTDRLSPNVIGPDIGCGMLCVNLGKIKDLNLELFDHRLRKSVPSGLTVNDKKDRYYQDYRLNLRELRCFKQLHSIPELERALGSLGGGNHFIELDKDEEDNIYLVIHTRSRNLGKQVWEIYNRYPTTGDYLTYDNHLQDYLEDIKFCNVWAKTNRMLIAQKLLSEMRYSFSLKSLKKCSFDCPHNYIEENLVRKGAIKAVGQVIIPMNMRDGCIIGTGRSNEDWNFSGPHGAGRLYSRNEAKKLITLEEYKESMSHIFTTSVNESTIDESPQAYKPMEQIVSKIGDTVKIDKIIKPIYNFKHSS